MSSHGRRPRDRRQQRRRRADASSWWRGAAWCSPRGGFSANERLRKDYMPYPDQHVSLLPEENTGDGIAMALAAGASLDGENLFNGVWAVVSTMTREDGYLARYAHLIDMSKPGMHRRERRGERFGNEASVSFVDAMHASGAVPAHIIGDAQCVKKYGMGLVFPGAGNLNKLVNARLCRPQRRRCMRLRQQIGVDPEGLERTVACMNRYAISGTDADFHKGERQIDREIGDPKHGPNPCLGAVAKPPFYAIKIYPGDGSTTVGLRIDAQCRVLGSSGDPLPGLYAAGSTPTRSGAASRPPMDATSGRPWCSALSPARALLRRRHRPAQ